MQHLLPTVEPVSNGATQADMPGGLDTLPPAQRFLLLGEVIYLLARNPIHRGYSIDDFQTRVIPALSMNQFRLYRNQDRPLALMTWAFLSDELDERLRHEEYDLKTEDWNGGDHLWFMDFVAPFGHGKLVIDDFTENVFPDRVARTQRAKPTSRKKFVLQTFYGNEARRNRNRKNAMTRSLENGG